MLAQVPLDITKKYIIYSRDALGCNFKLGFLGFGVMRFVFKYNSLPGDKYCDVLAIDQKHVGDRSRYWWWCVLLHCAVLLIS
jgi:hypothetical protein